MSVSKTSEEIQLLTASSASSNASSSPEKKQVVTAKRLAYAAGIAVLLGAAVVATTDRSASTTRWAPNLRAKKCLFDQEWYQETGLKGSLKRAAGIFNNQWSKLAKKQGLDPMADVFGSNYGDRRTEDPIFVPSKYVNEDVTCALFGTGILAIMSATDKCFLDVKVDNLRGLSDLVLDDINSKDIKIDAKTKSECPDSGSCIGSAEFPFTARVSTSQITAAITKGRLMCPCKVKVAPLLGPYSDMTGRELEIRAWTVNKMTCKADKGLKATGKMTVCFTGCKSAKGKRALPAVTKATVVKKSLKLSSGLQCSSDDPWFLADYSWLAWIFSDPIIDAITPELEKVMNDEVTNMLSDQGMSTCKNGPL